MLTDKTKVKVKLLKLLRDKFSNCKKLSDNLKLK